jgi:NAD(P)-dependent dehydrogenase (short-subunit alcohol dehydrogenase family)
VASIFVTGSTAGIGREIAATLVDAGHRVVLHARNHDRAAEALAHVPEADGIVVGDLASLAETRNLAEAARRAGPFDAVIHNAGLGGSGATRTTSKDGIEQIFQINVLAPYLITALMEVPKRLIYLSSGLQENGHVDLDDLEHTLGPWRGMQAYSDSKLCDVLLAFAFARRWPDARSNAVDPGWIKTKMGGPGATDELAAGADTPIWLATGDDGAARLSGSYLHRRSVLEANPAAYDPSLQDGLIAACAQLTGVDLAG